MASTGDHGVIDKRQGVFHVILDRLEVVYGLLKDDNEDAKRSLRETIDFVSSVKPFTLSKSTPTSPLLKRIMEEASKLDLDKLRSEGKVQTKLSNDYAMKMISATGQVQLLQLLVRKIKAKKILEVGTYLGYASFGMAEVMAPGGKVTGIDNEPYYRDFVIKTAKEHNLNVEVILGDAIPVLSSLAERREVYDFIYIDCIKREYSEYYRIIMDNNMLHKDGVIAVDNTIFKGAAITLDSIPGRALNDFATMVASDERVTAVMLPVYDGMYLIQHK